MKKTVISTVLYSLAAAVVTISGMLLCLGLFSGEDSLGDWNVLLMLPSPVAVIIAVVLILTDVAALVLTVLLIISNIRGARALKEKEEKRKKNRFSRLSLIDEEAKKAEEIKYDDVVSLSVFCDAFRDFAASKMGLYYEKDVIRSYVAALSVTHLTIMQGISGTGKTSLAYAFGEFTGTGSVMAPVQPSWKDRSDLLGYYNEFTDSYTETELLSRLYEAARNDRVYTVVLDEMNIARVEYYFAEFLSLLELPAGPGRRIRVTSDSRDNDPELFENGTMDLPENVWFTGTANNDDSTLAISDKVYDRAFVIELNRRAKPFAAPLTESVNVSAKRLKELFEEARRGISVSPETMKKIEELDEYLIKHFSVTFGNRIMKQTERFIPVFVACGGSETTALDIILCRKVLRKLEAQNPVCVRAGAEGLIRKIKELFGTGSMPECTEYLMKFGNM